MKKRITNKRPSVDCALCGIKANGRKAATIAPDQRAHPGCVERQRAR